MRMEAHCATHHHIQYTPLSATLLGDWGKVSNPRQPKQPPHLSELANETRAASDMLQHRVDEKSCILKVMRGTPARGAKATLLSPTGAQQQARVKLARCNAAVANQLAPSDRKELGHGPPEAERWVWRSERPCCLCTIRDSRLPSASFHPFTYTLRCHSPICKTPLHAAKRATTDKKDPWIN